MPHAFSYCQHLTIPNVSISSATYLFHGLYRRLSFLGKHRGPSLSVEVKKQEKARGFFSLNGLEVERDISELLAQVPLPLGRFSVIFIIGNLVSLSRVNLVGNGPKRGTRNLKINASSHWSHRTLYVSASFTYHGSKRLVRIRFTYLFV